jgi:hypothetical protein
MLYSMYLLLRSFLVKEYEFEISQVLTAAPIFLTPHFPYGHILASLNVV